MKQSDFISKITSVCSNTHGETSANESITHHNVWKMQLDQKEHFDNIYLVYGELTKVVKSMT